jgi:small subunit ribosomal protein S10
MSKKNQEMIRLRLESFDNELLDIACKNIIEKINVINSKIVGPIKLPTKRRVYCVLTSPHVNKDAREHFEIKIYRCIFDLYNIKNEVANFILHIELPSGVNIVIK